MAGAGRVCATAALLLVACSSRETPRQAQARMEKETEAFTAAAASGAKRYAGWIAAGQVDSVPSLFTEQGRQMPPNEPPAVGRAAIKAFEARNAAAFASKLAIRGESYVASGPLGIERGSYTFEGKAKPAAPKGLPPLIKDEGKYLIHWHNVNGRWQIAEMIWNSNRSMRAAGMPGKQKPGAHMPAKGAPTTAKKKQ